MPDPATTPAHEGGEREMDIEEVSAIADGTLRINPDSEGLMKELARDYLRMDAEITRLRERIANAAHELNGYIGPEVGGLGAELYAYYEMVGRAVAALAGTSADAGARETVTVWGRTTDAAAVLRTWESMGTEPFEGAHPYSVTITVTPGKERGT